MDIDDQNSDESSGGDNRQDVLSEKHFEDPDPVDMMDDNDGG